MFITVFFSVFNQFLISGVGLKPSGQKRLNNFDLRMLDSKAARRPRLGLKRYDLRSDVSSLVSLKLQTRMNVFYLTDSLLNSFRSEAELVLR